MINHPSYRWVVICLYLFSSVSAQMVINTIGILLPAITAGLALSPGQQGILGSSPFWSTIVLAVPIGWAGSRVSPKWLTATTLVVCALCLFLQSWAPVFAVLLLGRLLFGIGTIAQQPARVLLTRQWFPPREIVLVNGLSNVFFGLVVGGGLALSPVVLILLGDDWRGTLRVFGFYYVAPDSYLAAIWKGQTFGRVLERRFSANSSVIAQRAQPPGPMALWRRLLRRHHGFFGLPILLPHADAGRVRRFSACEWVGTGA